MFPLHQPRLEVDNDNYTKLESTTDATLLARDWKCRHGPIWREQATLFSLGERNDENHHCTDTD